MIQYQLWLVAAFMLLGSLFSFGQNIGIPVPNKIPAQLEKIHDQYLPNAYENKKTAPGYRSNVISPRGTSIFTMQANVYANGENILGDAANEPNIAINPKNENEIVIGWREFDNVTSDFRQAGWSYTKDGGQTWTFPGSINPGIFRSDPVLDYDSAGNFYYNSLTVDNFGNFLCKVFKSTNGGASWDNGANAHGGDKQWMTIDRTRGIGSGNVYSFWTFAYSSCLPGFFTRSTDEDENYDNCSEVDGNPFWGTMAVGNNGELYIAGTDTIGNIIVTKSLNAQSADSTVSWSLPVTINLDGILGSSPNVNPDGLLGQVNVDINRSDGVGRGNIYVVASVTPLSNADPGDVMFARSTDGGSTWSAPVRINDDSSTTNTQWFGTMSVALNGRIDVIWLDTRNASLFTDSSALYYSYSTDEGMTWSPNEKLSPDFDPHVGYPVQNKMGDYFDMVSDNGGAHLSWANTLNGEEDVYYSYIVPMAVSSVNGVSMLNFSVYPNPTTGKFICTIPVFNLNNSTNASRIEIYNEIGEIVSSQPILKTNTELDLSSQPSGIYFVKVEEEHENSAIRKIVRE